MPLPPDGVTMDNSHRGGTDESGDVHRVHFGSPSDNKTFVYGRSYHDEALLDLLIPRHTLSPPRLRIGDYNANGSAANSVGDATNKVADDAANNASNNAADKHANASSAKIADGVATAVLAEDAIEDAADDAAGDAADDTADDATGNAAVGKTTSTQTLHDPPPLLPFDVLPSRSIEMLCAASNNIFEIP